MKKVTAVSALALAGLWLWRKRYENTSPESQVPGRARALRTWAIQLGAGLLQGHAPLRAMSSYLDGFHFYADDVGRQVEAHHYCSQLNEDFIQCVIFDGNTDEARLIGIEYIVTERLFETLPEEERRLWHSHHHEVASGTLIAPGVPARMEHALMKGLINTYGKTWMTWPIDRRALPLGIPALMMGITVDGQLRGDLRADRDRRFHLSTLRRRRARADIPIPSVLDGANAWADGHARQLELRSGTAPAELGRAR